MEGWYHFCGFNLFEGEADSRQLSIVSTVIAVGFFIIMIALMYFGGRLKK
jgi:preprotein translocase subunit SecG